MNYPDLQTLTLVGRIAALAVIKTEDERDCLVVTMYHRITTDVTISVKFLNSNGLLTAYTNNNLVIGQELTVTGKLTGIRSFYMKDDVLTPLKQPEFQLKCLDYAFGSKPQLKEQPEPLPEVTFVTSKNKAKTEPALQPAEWQPLCVFAHQLYVESIFAQANVFFCNTQVIAFWLLH